jgi:hypothetical protein
MVVDVGANNDLTTAAVAAMTMAVIHGACRRWDGWGDCAVCVMLCGGRGRDAPDRRGLPSVTRVIAHCSLRFEIDRARSRLISVTTNNNEDVHQMHLHFEMMIFSSCPWAIFRTSANDCMHRTVTINYCLQIVLRLSFTNSNIHLISL